MGLPNADPSIPPKGAPERIATLSRLSTSIVHDLRNPLAAIYAGAEMLMDSNLRAEQTQRLARNIYRASRGIQNMLQQLLKLF